MLGGGSHGGYRKQVGKLLSDWIRCLEGDLESGIALALARLGGNFVGGDTISLNKAML